MNRIHACIACIECMGSAELEGCAIRDNRVTQGSLLLLLLLLLKGTRQLWLPLNRMLCMPLLAATPLLVRIAPLPLPFAAQGQRLL